MYTKQLVVFGFLMVMGLSALKGQKKIGNIKYSVSRTYVDFEDKPDLLEKAKEQFGGTPVFATRRTFNVKKSQNSSKSKLLQCSETAIVNKKQESLYFQVDAGSYYMDFDYCVIQDGLESTIDSRIFNKEGKAVLGPFLAKDIIIVQRAKRLISTVNLELTDLFVDFKGSVSMETGFGASFDCNDNINCDSRSMVQQLEKSIVRVLLVLDEGLGFCSGSLMNNTRNDNTPYILGGFHCQDGFTPLYNMWRFDFLYQSNTCQNPTAEPAFRSLSGCKQLAGRQESDFLLLELTQDIPFDFEVYYNGWNINDDYHPEPAIMIHHPAGDIKKISYETDDLRVLNSGINWDNDIRTPAEHHYICELDQGTHQPGSSGAPLFDMQGHVIGQLHGGITDEEECNLTRAYYGRLQKSWNEGDSRSSRLVDWLDPIRTGAKSLDGLEQKVTTINYKIEITTDSGIPLNEAHIDISGGVQEVIVTDQTGTVNLSNIAANTDFTISVSKTSDIKNGLSVTDMVQIRNHVLGISTFDSNIKLLAADVNNNGSVSVTDIVQMQNVILGLWDEFPNTDSWGFLPSEIEVEVDEENTEINITAYKVGDVNFSADPSK